MTQDDIDSGCSICLVGVAPPKPAEFVIFHIGQEKGTEGLLGVPKSRCH
jgi:phage tail sheath protein FI